MRWEYPVAGAGASLQALSGPTIESEPHIQYATDISTDSTVVWPWREYKSSPHTPPHLNITHYGHSKTLADGYIFITPADVNSADGTEELSGTGYIMTSEGELVYATEETGFGECRQKVSGVTDFRKQMYNGRPHLTYWNGCNTKGTHWGHRWGTVTFIDETYQNFTINPELEIDTMDPATVGQIDVHEHQMTERNSILVSSYNNSQYDITEVGGNADSWISDGIFFEIDVETQEVIFEWRALDWIPLSASRMGWNAGGKADQQAPWDWFHINSVQLVGDNYLVNARHHWAMYLIDGKDGHVIWKFDGVNGGDFGSIPKGADFRWQHHARGHNVSEQGMEVSLFNNKVAGEENEHTQTEGLMFYLPMPANPANPPVLLRKLVDPSEPLFAGTQGSYTTDIGNGNQFMGYGSLPIAREYGPASEGNDLRWQGQFGAINSVQSYRAFKDTWRATPALWDPSLVVEKARSDSWSNHGKIHCYVSWNGATEVEDWVVYAGQTEEGLQKVGVAIKKGFETKFELDGYKCVQVEAIQNGVAVRMSNVACVN